MTEKAFPNQRSEAFIRQVMDEWGGTVFKLAFAQTTSKADAEDVYQEVFIRLFKSRDPFDSPEHLKAWLLRVTVNCCRDLYRSGWKSKVISIENYENTVNGSAQAIQDEAQDTAAQDAEQDLARALKALPENMRAAIHLYYYEGYSTDETARILNIEPSTLRTRMQRARERLKKELGGADYGTDEGIHRKNGSDGSTCPSQ